VSEEAGRQQLARMMDEKLAQTKTIEAQVETRRQVETSNNAARDVQQQYLHSLCPTVFNSIDRSGELHGMGYYHVGSPMLNR